MLRGAGGWRAAIVAAAIVAAVPGTAGAATGIRLCGTVAATTPDGGPPAELGFVCRNGRAAVRVYGEASPAGAKRLLEISFPRFGFLYARSTLAVDLRGADGSAIADPRLRVGIQLKRHGRVYVSIGSVPADGRTRVLVPVRFPSDVRPPQPVRLKAYAKGPGYVTTWTKSFVVDLRGRAQCGDVHAAGLHAFEIEALGVACPQARTFATRYLEAGCFGRDAERCAGGGFTCRTEFIDFPSPIRCEAGSRRIEFMFDA